MSEVCWLSCRALLLRRVVAGDAWRVVWGLTVEQGAGRGMWLRGTVVTEQLVLRRGAM